MEPENLTAEAFFAANPGPYPSLQAAADAYYGQATTDEQLKHVRPFAQVSDE